MPPATSGESRISIVMHQQGERRLLQIVLTLRPPCRLASSLNGRQQQSDENADDGNHHKQLNEGKRDTRSRPNLADRSPA